MKIVCYTTPQIAVDPASDTRYLMGALSENFDVRLVFEADPAPSRGAQVVFDRFPLPMDREFVRRLAGGCDPLVINRSEPRLRFGSKRTLELFPHLTAPTVISDDVAEIRAFVDEHGLAVLKPVCGHKGEGVIRVDASSLASSPSGDVVSSYLDRYGLAVAQRFIPEVLEHGDKRINIFGFESISAVTTLPAEGSFICHESSGGSARADDITPIDERIVQEVVTFLREHDVWWAGVDVVGPYLTEVNITCPTMIRRADEVHGSTRGRDVVIRKLGELVGGVL